MRYIRPRRAARSAPAVCSKGGRFIDSLESRLLMAADSELRWMIAAAGGTPAPSPALTVAENLTDQNGYPRTTIPGALTLAMTAAPEIAAVKVNGVVASRAAGAQNGWVLANANNVIGLSPGINRVQVRGYDAGDIELTRKTIDVWYDDGSVQNVPAGSLTGNNTWTAAGGPYFINADLTIPAGSSLTIQPGTTVFLGYQARLIVNGRLNAEGTDYKHIRFTRDPVSGSNWARIELRNSSEYNKIAYADIEYAQSTDGGTVEEAMRVDRAKIYLDHIHFANVNRMYIDLTNASIDVRHSIFPSMPNAVELVHYLADGGIMPAGSFGVMDGNVFGPAAGYNDIIDWTGGQRPGPAPQFLNNWFLGGTDDGIDMDSTDAWIEGNVFMNLHQNINNSSKSHAVSTGNDFNVTSEITVVRNLFYDVDHAALIKSGAYGTFVNNTIVNVNRKFTNVDSTSAVINFYEPRSGQWQGRGARLEGNIIHNASRLWEIIQPFPAGRPEAVQIHVDNSILPTGSGTSQAGANITFGPGVKFGDPLLAKVANVIDPTIDFALLANSPAIGAGPFGRDMGGLVPGGVILSGEPASPTNVNDVTLSAGFLYGTGTNAAGYTHYKYRVNNGAWSAETPTTTPITLNNLADGTYTVYAIGKNDTGAWQSEAAATASKTFSIDTVAPKVTSATFHHETPAHSMELEFGEAVTFSGAGAELKLTNLTTGAVMSGSDIVWQMDEDKLGATLTFANVPNGRLPEGRYRLSFEAAGVRDIAGNVLDGDGDGAAGGAFGFGAFFKTGDVNHDGAVNFSDLVILAQNYGGTGKSLAEGNLDYDAGGNVNFTDLVILAQTYGTSLPAEGPMTSSVQAMPSLASVVASPPQRTVVKSKPQTTARPTTSIFNSSAPVQPKKPAPRKRV
jgi:hypothetical protein